MRFLLAALLMLLAAPFATPAAAQLEGTYALAYINGDSLPAASPAEENVIIDEMRVLLGMDARYTMRFRVHRVASDSPFELEVSGTYRIEGDRLLFHPDEGTVAEPVTYGWALNGETLRLVDEFDEAYDFARQ